MVCWVVLATRGYAIIICNLSQSRPRNILIEDNDTSSKIPSATKRCEFEKCQRTTTKSVGSACRQTSPKVNEHGRISISGQQCISNIFNLHSAFIVKQSKCGHRHPLSQLLHHDTHNSLFAPPRQKQTPNIASWTSTLTNPPLRPPTTHRPLSSQRSKT